MSTKEPDSRRITAGAGNSWQLPNKQYSCVPTWPTWPQKPYGPIFNPSPTLPGPFEPKVDLSPKVSGPPIDLGVFKPKQDRGWICPKCDKSVAPWLNHCDCSGGK